MEARKHSISNSILEKIDSAIQYNHNHESSAELDNKTIVKKILMNAIPATMGLLFIFICETINIVFIGSLNNAELISAIGIGTLYLNATGYILGIGLLGGIDTLCSQAYGARQYKLMSFFMNIGRFVLLLFFFFICIPFVIFADSALLAIGQLPSIAALVSEFSYSMIPSLFFAFQYNAVVRYLQSMQLFIPAMVITMCTSTLHILWCYIFIIYFDYRIIGAGIAMGITQCLNFIAITSFILIARPIPECEKFFPRECFQLRYFADYLKLALPSTILFAADYLGFEILTLMSSFLGPLALASNVILFNFITIIFMFPNGISFASTALVGNEMGKGDIKSAKRYSILAVIVGLCLMSTTTLLVVIFRNQIPYLYTSEPDVTATVIDLLGIYIIFALPDSVQTVLHGVIKGLGKQSVASAIALFFLYPFNISLAYTLAFTYGLGVLGLWYSQLYTIICISTSYAIYVLIADWKGIAQKIKEKFEIDHESELKAKFI